MSISQPVSPDIYLFHKDLLIDDRVIRVLGVVVPQELVSSLQRLDKAVDWERKYQNLPSVKASRAKDINEKMKTQLEQEAAELQRGITYESGVAPVAGDDEAAASNVKKKRAKKTYAAGEPCEKRAKKTTFPSRPCPRCKKMGHSRTNSKRCDFNPANIARRAAEQSAVLSETAESAPNRLVTADATN